MLTSQFDDVLPIFRYPEATMSKHTTQEPHLLDGLDALNDQRLAVDSTPTPSSSGFAPWSPMDWWRNPQPLTLALRPRTANVVDIHNLLN
jgi:hypothetical protein